MSIKNKDTQTAVMLLARLYRSEQVLDRILKVSSEGDEQTLRHRIEYIKGIVKEALTEQDLTKQKKVN